MIVGKKKDTDQESQHEDNGSFSQYLVSNSETNEQKYALSEEEESNSKQFFGSFISDEMLLEGEF